MDLRRSYRQLDADCIVDTATRLQRRISERFPDSGLSGVAAELVRMAGEARGRYQLLRRPVIPLRVAVVLLVAGLIAAEVGTAAWLARQSAAASWSDFVQGLDAAVNALIVSVGAIFFLVTFERRLKRRGMLKALQEFRALAHVIEMHQLTKDPDRLLFSEPRTASSPELRMTPFLLTRYLDYCSEMLAVTSNLTALYAQGDDDPVTLEAVDAVESLASGISHKIWQKMMIVHAAGSLAKEGRVPIVDRGPMVCD
jgi:hypothetical protein